MSFSVITYATHSQGMFEELVKGYPSIHVGGFGKKWNGFMDKNNFIREYSEAQDPEHIVIYVDGFDTRIVNDVRKAVKRFKRERCRILVSHGTMEAQVGRSFRRRIFGVHDHNVANAGLYMGYATDIAALTRKIELSGESDDQKALNTIFHNENELDIRIDYNHCVFYNTTFQERSGNIESNAIFLGFNATVGWDMPSLKKVRGYCSAFGPEWIAVTMGVSTGAMGPFVLDKTYHCNNMTALFGILFPLLVIPVASESGDDLYLRVLVFMIATMVTFHVSHLVKSRLQHAPSALQK